MGCVTINDGPLARLDARLHAGRIVMDLPDDELAHLLQAGTLVIFSIWPESTVMAYRRAAQAWAAQRAPHPFGQSASVPGLSFHRLDDEQAQSHLPHVFHQIALCEQSHSDSSLWAASCQLLLPLLDLQNRVAGTQLDFSGPTVRVKVVNHPVGGGYLVRHAHPYEPMRVAFFLSLARPGVDYREGDVVFHLNGTTVPLGGHFSAGSAVFFRYDLPHEVTPVDPDAPRDWSDRAGLWLASVELVESHRRTSRT